MIFIIGGGFQLPNGKPAVGGTLLMQLSRDNQLTPAAYMDNGYKQANVVAGIPATFTLDANGNVPADSQIWSNAELWQPSYYLVRVFSFYGAPITRYSVSWIFTTLTGGTQDLGQMVNQTIPAGDEL